MKKLFLVFGVSCVLFVGAVVVLAILVVGARGANEVISVKIDGVCIDAPEPGYESERGGDRMVVRKDDDLLMILETRADPAPYAAAFVLANAKPGEFVPVGDAPSQYVGADPSSVNRIAVITFESGKEADRRDLLAGIRFCPEASADAKP